MDIETLKKVVCEVITTHTDELSCSECFELLDKYAEFILVGQDAVRRMPHVHDHLERCTDCGEEWSGLLAALQAVSRDLSGPTTTGHPCRQKHSRTEQNKSSHL